MTIYSRCSHQKIVIFHSYVSLPEGISIKLHIDPIKSYEITIKSHEINIEPTIGPRSIEPSRRRPKHRVRRRGRERLALRNLRGVREPENKTEASQNTQMEYLGNI